jgi:hypothetical protein
MADPIVIQVRLGTDEVARAGQEIAQRLSNALNTGVAAARDAGRKIGEALNSGIASGLSRASREDRERAHARRIEAIHAQSAARLQEIEARKQAQLDAIRERAVQREIEQQRRLERAAQQGGGFQTFLRRYSSTIREAGESIQQAGFAALGLTGLLVGLGTTAVRSAIDLDKQINVLKALTGSAETAEKRFAQLIATAQRSPGLTTSLAATLDAQLRTLNVAESTINRILPALGRLNAISPLADPGRFVGNLVQLITQNFERQDLKELVGQSAFAGELIKQIFNVDSPTNAKAIREAAQKLGINSVETFIAAFATAAENNPKLQKVTESLGTQIQKLQDRLVVALRPLGLRLLDTIIPAVERLVPIVERLLDAFSRLSPGMQTAIIGLGALAAAVGPVVVALGGLIQTLGALGNLIVVFKGLQVATTGATGAMTAFGLSLGPVGVALGVVSAAVVATGIIWFEYQRRIDASTASVRRFIEQGSQVDAAMQRTSDRLARVEANVQRAQQVTAQAQKTGLIDLGGGKTFDPRTAPPLTPGTRLRVSVTATDTPITTPPAAPPPTPAGDRISRAVSDTRALRDAQLRAEQEFQRNQFELLRDANERLLREEEESFRLRLIDADQFYKDKLGLLQANIGNEINLLNNQLIAVQEAFNKSKPNTAERVRLGQQINELQTQIELKTRAIGDVERQVFRESVRARQEVIDLSKQQLEVSEQQNQKEKEILATIHDKVDAQTRLLAAAREALERQGEQLDAQLLATGSNLDLKMLNAQKAALLEIKQADEDAILSMIRNRERLADAQIFHADRANAIFLDHLARQQSVTEATADAMIKAYEGVASSLDRGIDRLTKKLGVFGEVINGILKSIVRGILTNLFAPTFGSGQQAGGGGLLGSILGSIFGNQAGGGLLGNIFRTPGFNPAAGGGFNFGSLFGLASGLSAPPSITGIFANGQFAAGLRSASGGATGIFANGQFAAGLRNSALLANLGNLFKGIGFGLPAGGARGALAGALPLLGLSLGAGLGGSSILGQLLGGAGGALLGIGLTAAPAALLGSSFAFLAPLFSNPITAIIGAALLPAAILLGRAKQRRKDEQSSGDFLTQAIAQIRELRQQIASDQLDGGQARSIFENQILAGFIQQINTLKTKSVRESRLTNQVRDLRNLFDKEVVPEIEAQKRRRAISGKLVPEFASGGIVPGFDFGRDSVLSLLRPREMVLTLEQQATIARIAGGDVFSRAGVPGVQQQSAFAAGGIVPLASATQPVVIEVDEISISIGEDDASRILFVGARTNLGRSVIIRANKEARLNREVN